MSLSWLSFLCFIVLFAASLYVLSGIDWSKFFKNQDPARNALLLLLLSIALAYLCTQGLLSITVYNHL